MPNFNYGKFIYDAIKSCVYQDCTDIEIIVLDDGSTDQSKLEIERACSDFGDIVKPIF